MAQTACTCAHLACLSCDFSKSALGDAQLNVAEEEFVFFLANKTVFGFCEDAHECFFVERGDGTCGGYASDELWDQAVFLEVCWCDVIENIDPLFASLLLDAEGIWLLGL
jgi:hypothetical protein